MVLLATWGLGWELVVAAAGEGCGAVTHETPELPQKLLEACESVLGFILCLSGRCMKRGGSLGSFAAEPSPVRCPRRLGKDAGPVPVRMCVRQK